jgi:catalase
VIAASGGTVAGTAVERTFATARSIEFDALLVASNPSPAPDVAVPPDAGGPSSHPRALDPRVRILIEECFRQSKIIGATGSGLQALSESNCQPGPGILTADSAVQTFSAMTTLLPQHRVWERFSHPA